MQTLKIFLSSLQTVPATVTWLLSDISEAKGKQDLFMHQSPQTLKLLREHALIESAVSSNRIEGVEIESKRTGTVVFGRPLLKDRNEEEIQGYRDALQWIHGASASVDLDQAAVLRLHQMSRGDIWDAGQYKEKNGNIIERLPNGEVRIRFTPVSAALTGPSMNELFELYGRIKRDAVIHPLIAMAAFSLDFLCIHPFRDGNGRVSRLLILMQLYHNDFLVGRYISIERLIEEFKERYYETLEQSSQRWHEGRHDPWPYIQFLLYIIKKAYAELFVRVDHALVPKGEKSRLIISQIEGFNGEFTVTQLMQKCPSVSRDLIRHVLKKLSNEGKIVSRGRGPAARWQRKGNTPL